MGKIYNISASCSFADVLANRFLQQYQQNPLELADVIFVLPSNRAVSNLKEAFVKAKGKVPTLLPQMKVLGNLDEQDWLLTDFADKEILQALKPSIDRTERLFLFIKLISSKPEDYGIEPVSLSQAYFLAQALADLIDKVNLENLDFANLAKLVPEEYASHWQEILKFLHIITAYWPQILVERNLSDISFNQNLKLLLQAGLWQKNLPANKIIIAGTTATYPALKTLVKAVAKLPNAEIYLYALDKYLSDDAWNNIEDTHPQFETKALLDFLEISRFAVEDVVPPSNEARESLLSQVMCPALSSDKWRETQNKDFLAHGLENLQTVTCAEIADEATAVALIMRQVLETEGKTAELVTTNRDLARRVVAELKRWDIAVDDSSGVPLLFTPLGVFLSVLFEAAMPTATNTDLLSMLKHPLCAMGLEKSELRKKVRDLEKQIFRAEKNDEESESFLMQINEMLLPLKQLLLLPKSPLSEIIKAHLETAERASAKEFLWKGNAAESAANLFADIASKTEILGEIDPKEYLPMLQALMAQVMVRNKFGTHPRLKILGPIEARFMSADVVILGEVNEGSWPKSAAADPWMSRQMKKSFGLSLPDKNIGILAFDFATLCSANEVFLIRAERVEGVPAVKSRWWLRLETFAKALGLQLSENDFYKNLSAELQRVDQTTPILPPKVFVPQEYRPRELSATDLENLIRDPYIIFAKKILKLAKLEDVEKDPTVADYGNIVHQVLQEFNQKYNGANYPQNAYEQLLEMGRKLFESNQNLQEKRVFWWQNFENMMRWTVAAEQECRPFIAKIFNETKGQITLSLPKGNFVLHAKADRVELLTDGMTRIVDYKTGYIPKVKDVLSAWSPQLLLEAIILQQGGFIEIGRKETEALVYWQLGIKEQNFEEKLGALLEESASKIRQLLEYYDDEKNPYLCRPNLKRAPKYSDYEHLARIDEWKAFGGADE